MAFPASDTHKDLGTELAKILVRARAVRNLALSTHAALAAGPVTSERLLSIAEEAQLHHDWLTVAASVPGIAAYAAANLAPTVTANGIGTDFTALLNALAAVVAEVTSSFPAGGYANDPPIVDGVRSLRTYSSAATATLRTRLQAVADAVATA